MLNRADNPAGRRLADLLVDAAATTAAVAGLLLDLSGREVGLLLVLVAVVVVSARLVVLTVEPGSGRSPLGRLVVVRATPMAAVAAVLGDRGPGTAAELAGLAAAVLLGCLLAEPLVARAARFRVPVTARLPGVPAAPTSPELGPLAVGLSQAATAAGLLVVLLGGSVWWWVLAGAVAAVPLGVLAVTGRAKVAAARRLRTLVPEAVARYAPEFVLYTARPDDASYQMTMWLPYLQRAGLRFVVVVRNAVPAAALAELTDVPVIEARGMADLENLVVPSLRAAFYVNASSGNGAFVRFQHLTHIYLGHGDSDKPPSYNPTHAMYDEVFAAGPAATRRYAAHGVQIPAEKFRIVGRPQVEDVHPVARAIGDVTEPVVLYAPTWRGHVEETMLYSLPGGERIVAALLARGATVVFRPHPFSYHFADDAAVIRRIHAQLADDARRSGRGHLFGAAAETERGILDCINVSDAMVSDVSSVVSDYLFSGKPFAMVAVPAEPAAFVAEFPVAAASYVVRGDLDDLEPQLTAMLGLDPRRSGRLALRADYLGDFPVEHYADAFVEAVRHVTRQRRGDLDADDPTDLEASEDAGPEQVERDGDEGGGGAGGGEGATEGPLPRYRRLVLTFGLGVAATGLSLVTLVTAVTAQPAWVTAALAVVGVGLQYLAARQTRAGRRHRLLGEGGVTRAVLVVTLAVAAASTGTTSGPVALALVLLAVAVAGEPVIQSAWGRFGLTAVNLPDALHPLRQPVSRHWLPAVGTTVLLLGFVLRATADAGLAGGPAATGFVVVAVLAFLVFVHVVERALRRAVEVTRGELRLQDALVARAPEFTVYFASTVGAGYQVGMWLPYFAQIGRPFVVVTRTVSMLNQIARLCEELGLDVPLVHRPSLRSLEDVIVPSMTSAFYVNNAVRNTHFIERRELTHVWLNHGDSEKPACYNPVHAIYDLIFAAGQAGIDRYARHGVHIPREKFLIVGRPQVELIETARGPVAEQRPPTVLYAPTWQGPYADTRVYSLPEGAEIVQQLLDRGARVVFRAHPFNYRYAPCRAMIAEIGALLDGDRARTGLEHLWGPAAERELSVEDCFNLSDAMVADVSAVVSDYLRSEKPFAMVSMGRTPEELVVEAPAARAAYVLREDLSNLGPVLNDLLGPDPLAPVRRESRVYHLGDFAPGTDTEGFLAAARDVVDGRYATAEAAAHLDT